jgi:bifunctional non-homologous end joining protein LigD
VGLQDYRKKRDFSQTPEPAGKEAKAGGDSFVVQKHAARRLHYDLRLEHDGVLKSWAVANGPSLVPGEKRLAIEVEDHPLDYGSFEGNIPKGEYGGGSVIVWDQGTWRPEGDPQFGLSKGHLRFELSGHRLGGLWDLVRIRKKPGDRQQPWLLIKVADAHARSESDPDILEETTSVVTGRTIEDVAAGLAGEKLARKPKPSPKPKTQAPAPTKAAPKKPARKAPIELDPVDPSGVAGAVEAPLPSFIEPALASACARPPAGKDWLHEIKLDGYRLQARLDRGRVQLRTRNGLDWTSKFQVLTKDLALLPVKTAIIDGEVVVEDRNGVSSFIELKLELSRTRGDRFVLYLFDLLHLDGHDLRAVPFAERRALLERALGPSMGGRLRLTEMFQTEGGTLFKHVCRLGLEGIVSKRRASKYVSGRVKSWLKTKCALREEFLVLGYQPSTTSRKAIGSLALGYWKDGDLRYAGKVGTGFSHSVAEEIWEKLDPFRRHDRPVKEVPPDADVRGVRWVEPRLVADVEFAAWTGSGMIRHASFQGLREDKTAADLKKEGADLREEGAPVPVAKAKTRSWSIRLTHPDRIYWPDVGVSKLGLAEYYADIWPWIEPQIVGRPLSLLRCPSGLQECFFQKHAWKGMPAAQIRPAMVGDDEVLFIETLDGLIALVQAGVLEIHPWGSTMADPERPDRLIFDLDPGEDVPWAEVEAAAVEVRDHLSTLGLVSFVKTTGGKGLHVVVPITPQLDWAPAKLWCQRFAEAVAKARPDGFVTNMAKRVRGGKIFLDYLRNGRGATAIAAYSTRARPGAAVATPLFWDELGTGVTPSHFTVLNLSRRLQALPADPWAEMATTKQKLPPVGKIKMRG